MRTYSYNVVLPSEEACWICLDSMNDGKEVVAHGGELGAKHRVHKSCIKEWVVKSGSHLCPNCKEPTQVSSLFSWRERHPKAIRSSLIGLAAGGVFLAVLKAGGKPSLYSLAANTVGLATSTLLINGAVIVGGKVGQMIVEGVNVGLARGIGRQPLAEGKKIGQFLGEIGTMAISSFGVTRMLSQMDTSVDSQARQIGLEVALGVGIGAMTTMPARFINDLLSGD